MKPPRRLIRTDTGGGGAEAEPGDTELTRQRTHSGQSSQSRGARAAKHCGQQQADATEVRVAGEGVDALLLLVLMTLALLLLLLGGIAE